MSIPVFCPSCNSYVGAIDLVTVGVCRVFYNKPYVLNQSPDGQCQHAKIQRWEQELWYASVVRIKEYYPDIDNMSQWYQYIGKPNKLKLLWAMLVVGENTIVLPNGGFAFFDWKLGLYGDDKYKSYFA